MGETEDAWLAIGLDEDLDEAMKKSRPRISTNSQ